MIGLMIGLNWRRVEPNREECNFDLKTGIDALKTWT